MVMHAGLFFSRAHDAYARLKGRAMATTTGADSQTPAAFYMATGTDS